MREEGERQEEEEDVCMYVYLFINLCLYDILSFPFPLPSIPDPLKLALFIAIECVWNVYPSQAWSSALIHTCHLIILVGMLKGDTKSIIDKCEEQEEDKEKEEEKDEEREKRQKNIGKSKVVKAQ